MILNMSFSVSIW